MSIAEELLAAANQAHANGRAIREAADAIMRENGITPEELEVLRLARLLVNTQDNLIERGQHEEFDQPQFGECYDKLESAVERMDAAERDRRAK